MKSNIILFALLAILYTSCNRHHDSEKHNDHEKHNHHDEHDETKIQFTTYSNDFELFAEADPFVAGKSCNILSHFSRLPDFKALEEGSIKIRLIINGTETYQIIEKPTRKGIYSFDIKPEIPGKGEIVFDIITEEGNFQLKVAEVMVFATEHEAHEAAEEHDAISKTNTTVFTKEQSWKIDFATEFPKTEPFGQVIKTTALVQSAQGDEIIVTSKINGIVKIASGNVLKGKNISINQVLFTIFGNELANNNSLVRYTEAKNNFEKAKADYERLQELIEDKIASEKEFLNAKNQYENAKTIYENLNKNFSSAGQKVSSPMNGFVKQLFVQNGQYVEAGQPIVTISQNKTLLLSAEVQQKYASILSSINSANIRTLHDNKTHSFEALNGKILSYGKSTNTNNYLIPVNLQIDNKGSFFPGGFVEVYLKTLTNTQALTIPNTALLEEQGHYFVYVQITPELFEKREVKVQASDGLKTEITKGISQNERIVSKGAILIKLAQATGTLDAHSGHVH